MEEGEATRADKFVQNSTNRYWYQYLTDGREKEKSYKNMAYIPVNGIQPYLSYLVSNLDF